jgi:replicative DNA helicase
MTSPTSVSSLKLGADRVPPHSEEAERGVLGSVLLDADRVMDLCVEGQLSADSFYVPAHRRVFEAMLDLLGQAAMIDALTVAERLRAGGNLDAVGGSAFLDRLVDATPTSAHAEYYVDIVRQHHLLRSVISCARDAESLCFRQEDSADAVLSRVEQSFLNITDRQHGFMQAWPIMVKKTMEHIEHVFETQGAGGLRGVSTGFVNLDRVLQGLRPSEMIVLAARPSMGKTSLAMNIVENVALGRGGDHQPRPVGIFSLEMSAESLVMRMLCAHAEVSAFKLTGGYLSGKDIHGKLMQSASRLTKAPIFLDDTGGLDVMELRARARRMKKKHDIQVLVIDYLQLLHSRERAGEGRQQETAQISNNIKAMAKELNIPVLVLSQLSRAPERERTGKPKLSDLRDSGAIEQDADVVCMLRRPCKYEGDEESGDLTLAIVDVAKQRNGPTGEVRLNFDDEYTLFRDRAHGTDSRPEVAAFAGADQRRGAG